MITIKKRNTVQKTLILETVRSMTDHPTAEDVYAEVEKRCPNISRATVYRDLNSLATDGEILRVAIANASDRYDLTTVYHAHSRCSVCGKVFDCQISSYPVADADVNDGFVAKSVDIIVNGICRNCREEQNG